MMVLARALRPRPGSRPRAQRVIILALINAGEDPAERGRVRAARPPGPVPRRAQPQQQLFRRRRDPLPGRVQLVIPGHLATSGNASR